MRQQSKDNLTPWRRHHFVLAPGLELRPRTMTVAREVCRVDAIITRMMKRGADHG
jgi:hypothetical protein